MNMVLILPICKTGGTLHKDEHGTLAQICYLKFVIIFVPEDKIFVWKHFNKRILSPFSCFRGSKRCKYFQTYFFIVDRAFIPGIAAIQMKLDAKY